MPRFMTKCISTRNRAGNSASFFNWISTNNTRVIFGSKPPAFLARALPAIVNYKSLTASKAALCFPSGEIAVRPMGYCAALSTESLPGRWGGCEAHPTCVATSLECASDLVTPQGEFVQHALRTTSRYPFGDKILARCPNVDPPIVGEFRCNSRIGQCTPRPPLRGAVEALNRNRESTSINTPTIVKEPMSENRSGNYQTTRHYLCSVRVKEFPYPFLLSDIESGGVISFVVPHVKPGTYLYCSWTKPHKTGTFPLQIIQMFRGSGKRDTAVLIAGGISQQASYKNIFFLYPHNVSV